MTTVQEPEQCVCQLRRKYKPFISISATQAHDVLSFGFLIGPQHLSKIFNINMLKIMKVHSE